MQYVLSLSYGKDSLACLEACRLLGIKIDRIIHAEVWATDTIPADLPLMVEFKKKADQIILERYGLVVEHLCAYRNGEKLTYEKLFYHVPKRKEGGKFSKQSPAGFPYQKGAWCNDRLKTNALDENSRERERIAGFPFTIGAWCKKLKDGTYPRIPDLSSQGKLVYSPQTESFLLAPWYEERTQISYKYSALPLTNPKESNGIPNPDSSFLW